MGSPQEEFDIIEEARKSVDSLGSEKPIQTHFSSNNCNESNESDVEVEDCGVKTEEDRTDEVRESSEPMFPQIVIRKSEDYHEIKEECQVVSD
jgi:hypothetical protein